MQRKSEQVDGMMDKGVEEKKRNSFHISEIFIKYLKEIGDFHLF